MNVQAPHWKNQFDFGNLLTIAIILGSGCIAWGQITARMEAIQKDTQAWEDTRDKQATERRILTDTHFATLDAKTQPLDAMLYRLGKQEADTIAVNTRVDRVVDAFTDQLTGLRKDTNAVGTKVEVLSQTIADETRRQEGMRTPTTQTR